MTAMTKHPSTPFDLSTVSLRLSACAAALAGVAGTASNAQAAIVTFTTPISVPQTTAGVYINLLTGATGTSGGAVTGWDFNPYLASGGTQLGFYWNQSPANTSGGVVVGSTYQNLVQGTVVGPASTFGTAITGTTGSPYLTTGTNTLGFRFFNETTSAINFGYLTMTTTAGTPGGFPATVVDWTFQNDGTAITVAPIPEPATVLTVSALVAGACGLRRWRRRTDAAPGAA
jgi:hypothetical protein